MRDDMKMETWAMRITVQRRLGLPLDVACQAVEAGKKAPNGKPHDAYTASNERVRPRLRLRSLMLVLYLYSVA